MGKGALVAVGKGELVGVGVGGLGVLVGNPGAVVGVGVGGLGVAVGAVVVVGTIGGPTFKVAHILGPPHAYLGGPSTHAAGRHSAIPSSQARQQI